MTSKITELKERMMSEFESLFWNQVEPETGDELGEFISQALNETIRAVCEELGMETLFTKAELDQLISYAEHRDRDGWYYGPKAYFEKRHESILAKLQTLLSTIPKTGEATGKEKK